jgi:hypothetical protein
LISANNTSYDNQFGDILQVVLPIFHTSIILSMPWQFIQTAKNKKPASQPK